MLFWMATLKLTVKARIGAIKTKNSLLLISTSLYFFSLYIPFVTVRLNQKWALISFMEPGFFKVIFKN